MTTTPDIHGNLHKGAGAPDGGRFTGKENIAPADSLTTEEALEAHAVLMGPARALTRSFRIDATNADDIAQDAWVDLLKRKTKGGKPTTISELVKDESLLKLVSRTIAKRAYTAGGQDGLRHEEFQARRALQEQEAAFEKEHGRKMTSDERLAAADAIRLSQPPGRRPKEDFHVQYKRLSLDVRLEDDGPSLGDTMVADSQLSFDDQEDAAAHALHEMENGKAPKTDVRRDVWRIMSIRNGAPQVVPECVTSKDAKRHRDVVTSAGGAHALAQKWLDGETSPEEDAALFAPFGAIDVDDRERTAEVFDSHPGYADQLWGEALKSASRR